MNLVVHVETHCLSFWWYVCYYWLISKSCRYSTSAPQLSLKGFDTEQDLLDFYNTQPEVRRIVQCLVSLLEITWARVGCSFSMLYLYGAAFARYELLDCITNLWCSNGEIVVCNIFSHDITSDGNIMWSLSIIQNLWLSHEPMAPRSGNFFRALYNMYLCRWGLMLSAVKHLILAESVESVSSLRFPSFYTISVFRCCMLVLFLMELMVWRTSLQTCTFEYV